MNHDSRRAQARARLKPAANSFSGLLDGGRGGVSCRGSAGVASWSRQGRRPRDRTRQAPTRTPERDRDGAGCGARREAPHSRERLLHRLEDPLAHPRRSTGTIPRRAARRRPRQRIGDQLHQTAPTAMSGAAPSAARVAPLPRSGWRSDCNPGRKLSPTRTYPPWATRQLRRPVHLSRQRAAEFRRTATLMPERTTVSRGAVCGKVQPLVGPRKLG